jgi:hypothetical protein
VKILLVRDDNISIDLGKSVEILNRICRTVEFNFLPKPLTISSNESSINFAKDAIALTKGLRDFQENSIIYVTKKQYPDNYFYRATRDIMILSFSQWSHYTNLPLENGLFFFIARMLTLKVESKFRHEQSIGCVYDFLRNKTDVDAAMKMGYICEQCLERIRKIENKSDLQHIQFDVIEILTAISNTSKWGNSVFSLSKSKVAVGLDWSTFEDEVSQLYRELGANVKQDVNLAGFQIDVYVEEQTPSEQKVRSAVECKFYDKKVGNAIVSDFARKVANLKRIDKIDKGVIVSFSGFSQDASITSESMGIELLRYKDLEQRVNKIRGPHPKVVERTNNIMEQKLSQIEKKRERSPKIFVLMPFAPELDDLYFLGIHEVAVELQCSCDRVDKLEFDGVIMNRIYDSIENADAVVAEVSSSNLNVYYEVGYSHALKKPTVLITKDISKAPFDLTGYNHIIYNDIRDLKGKLKPRLTAILAGQHL